MKLTVATLRSILNEIDDDVVLATLDYGNGDFKTFSWIKRLLLLTDKTSGKQYLTINGMGSHFTGKGEQSHLKYAERYWDEDSVLEISSKLPVISCACSEDDKHGETKIWCCNHCGLPTEEWWSKH